jgi:hypothetical protein
VRAAALTPCVLQCCDGGWGHAFSNTCICLLMREMWHACR